MKGERDRKKAQRLHIEHDEQHSRGQRNTAENGSSAAKTVTRVGNQTMGCIPKTASLLSVYPIAPFSPGRDIKRPVDYGARWRMGNCPARGYSGRPLISIIPKEARGEKKGSGFDSQEPTSPKVSCMGQVKLKKKKCIAKAKEKNKDQSEDRPVLRMSEIGSEPKTLKLKKFISIPRDRKPDWPVSDAEATEEAVVHSLGQLKRFSSGRNQGDLRANIFQNSRRGDSWRSPKNTAEDSSVEDNGDVKRSVFADREVENPKNEDRKKKNSLVVISHSSSLLRQPLPKPAMSNGHPCEINLWKRRGVAPPMALDLERSYGLEMRQPSTA